MSRILSFVIRQIQLLHWLLKHAHQKWQLAMMGSGLGDVGLAWLLHGAKKRAVAVEYARGRSELVQFFVAGSSKSAEVCAMDRVKHA